MKKNLVSLSIIAALTMTAVSVNAETHSDSAIDQSGWWIGAASGVTTADGKSITGHRDKAVSPKLELGYDVNQYWGVYTGYDYVHRLGVDKLHIGSLGVKGQYELMDNLSVFGKLGASYIYSDISSSNIKTDTFTGSAGIGLEYQLTNAISTKVGYDYYDRVQVKEGRNPHLHQIYWGMAYKFGQPATPRVVTEQIEVIQERVIEVPVQVEVAKAARTDFLLPFALGKSTLEDLSYFYLNEVVDVMRTNPALVAHLVGRTDSTGSDAINNKISAQRAQAASQYLQSQGIDAKRINVSAVADSRPLTQGSADIERSVQIILK
ncbi:OmpA family protein [Vibrio metschnikovii]|uniref:OmpA family protein n=2 Tax=Unclassified Bacteria TaxID=49928 RepID=A0AAU6T1C2_UNCXX|nr:OmpA family protein [Vibrio metschnikovii]EEX36461.1 outer membrane protein A precursor [Vibrio metschnikovii CIP 69.14]EKO3556833.1 OmpA family protein [Vibrio metschnikovii]EKO3569004.1 OmpA family protein [Vibrio metschnikovii]EKO3576138.1 OmpA family protein [Vibrio metschnikovii]EKO3595387.1 OmpA family protein [Vibrio metschnikovii]